MVSHMVFLTKLGFENPKNLVTPSPFCKVWRVTELLDGSVVDPYTVPVLRFEKLWFRFRFQILKSYGMVPVPVPTFEKATVPVPVPAPYLDHKKQIFQKNSEIFFDFLLSKLF